MPAEVAVEMNGTKSARFAMTWVASMILAMGVTACSLMPGAKDDDERTPSGVSDRQVNQAEALSRKGDFRGAGRTYETLAAQSPGELRDRFLLRAALEYVRGSDSAKATALLNQVSEALPRADFPLRSLVVAELALRAGRADKAVAELDRIPQPIPRETAPDVLDLRARALFAMNRPAQAVGTALERERTLSSQEEVRANQRMIWQGLQKSAANNADFTPPPGASQQVIGWLDLGRAALVSARNPFTANEDIAQWRGRYPSHPANSLITEDILPKLGAGLDYPTQIALILPLSGRTQAAGMAVRDGFLAALLQQDPTRRPVLNVYDSAEMGAATAYRRAVADGAQFGPAHQR
jgi:outer membrane PBP1 activator LpoA protein